jgi:hypothetical protein
MVGIDPRLAGSPDHPDAGFFLFEVTMPTLVNIRFAPVGTSMIEISLGI